VVFTQTLDGIVTHWSSGAEQFYGLKAAEVLEKKLPSRIAPHSEVQKTAIQTVREKGEWSGRMVMTSADGSEMDLQMRWVLLDSSGQDPMSILVLTEDAESWREIREERLRAQPARMRGDALGRNRSRPE
jgi:PAS domain S-box-containing protein